MKRVIAIAAILCLAGMAQAATYYVDPATGAIGNDGSAGSPWNTLENVLSAKTPADGDTVLLKSGYHGTPTAGSSHAGHVTIMAAAGQVPVVKSLNITSPRWVFDGLTVTPSAVQPLAKATMVTIGGSATYVTVQNCSLYSVMDATAWDMQDWNDLPSKGISVSGDYALIKNNFIKNVGFGIDINKSAPFSTVDGNVIENFAGDGLRGLADDCLFQNNTVKNCYNVNDNHDDCFQSWSTDANGNNPGSGVVYRVTIRGNTFINFTDQERPFQGSVQGVGCFGGTYDGWVVENNLIMIDHYHGITLYDAKNCSVANNTVMTIPGGSLTTWITVTGTKGGNLVRNNIATLLQDLNATYTTFDHNISGAFAKLYVADYAGMDWTLKPDAPAYGGISAIDGGSADGAPGIDILGNTRPYGGGVDIGCYEYIPTAIEDNAHGRQRQDMEGMPGIGSNPVSLHVIHGLPANSVLHAADGSSLRPAQVTAGGIYYLKAGDTAAIQKIMVVE